MKGKGNEDFEFAICINNDGYEASLKVGRLYRVVSSDEATSHGYVCVIDESSEDYGYLTNRFVLQERSIK
jgi:hypothetical protein